VSVLRRSLGASAVTDHTRAGVIGLQTALLLLEDGRFDVTIAAKAWPDDSDPDSQYTSMWAGAVSEIAS